MRPDRAAHAACDRHPQHAGLVERRWDAQVVDFPEIDTVAIEP